MSSKKQEEYTAAIREADAARKQISASGNSRSSSNWKSPNKQKVHSPNAQLRLLSLNSDREARLKEFDEETRLQTESLQASRAERERVFNALPKQLSSQYNRISARIRDGVAVAEARNGACKACFMTLRPQAMAQVRRGEELVTCDNCNRILYYVPVGFNSCELQFSPAKSSAYLAAVIPT